MITWGAPWAFVLLLPALLLPLQPRITGVLRLAVPGPAVHEGGGSTRTAVAWLPRLLQVLGLCLVVIALAQPRTTRRTELIESEGLDIILAVDTSGSMRAEDFSAGLRPVNRLEVAKSVMEAFIDGRPHDRIGVVVFGAEAFTQVPLTLDHETLQAALQGVEIGVIGEDGTAIGTAIGVSAKRLEELDAPERVVILLTDGENNAGELSPLEAAEVAEALDIKVYTIGIGGMRRMGILQMVMGGLDEDTLKAVAEATHAQYFRATDANTLAEVFATIDELEPSTAEVEEIVQHTQLYRRFLVPGALLLVLQTLLQATWLRRWP